jgi:hypothetical protein
LDVVITRNGNADPACRDRVTAALPWVVDQHFDVAVLANAFDMYLQVPDENVRSAPGAEPSEGAEAYVAALSGLVHALEDAGTGVVVVHPIPKPAVTRRGRENFRTAAGCSFFGVVAGDAGLPLGCRDHFSGAEARERQHIALQAEQEATTGTNAVLLDPFDPICGGDECHAYQNDRWAYQDYGHVTDAHSDAALEDDFRAALSQALEP